MLPPAQRRVEGRDHVKDDQPARHIARWDGAAWSPMGSGTDWSSTALAAWGGYVVVAGGFETIDEVPVNYIARWQSDPLFGDGFD